MSKRPEMAAFFADEGTDFLSPLDGGAQPYEPYESITFTSDIFPIADTTTLPADFYEITDLDTRYWRDRRRTGLLDALSEVEGDHEWASHLFGNVCVEVKALIPALQPFEGFEPDAQTISGYLDSHQGIRSPADVHDYNLTFYSVPRPLRDLAGADLSSFREVAGIIATIPGINTLVDASLVAGLLEKLGISELKGLERIAATEKARPLLEELVADLAAKEKDIIGQGTSEGHDMRVKRILRKRYPVDMIDATTFKSCTHNGVIVDPGYLLDDSLYESLHDEPPVTFDETLFLFKHLVAGTWVLGHDHTLLYRNTDPNLPATHDAVIPDYGAIRPGNYVYHDLKLLEHGPYLRDFPIGAFSAYIRRHYLDQMDMRILDRDQTPPYEQAADATIIFNHDNQRYDVPLRKFDTHVIPFRALKKDFYSSEYYEYGEECYLAELVDIALQLDNLEQLRETVDASKTTQIGEALFSEHASALLTDLALSANVQPAHLAIVIEQLLFMKGKLVEGGRQAILTTLQNLPRGQQLKLENLSTTDELDETGEPIGERPPLTCSYEWFQRYARIVEPGELNRRGIPIQPALFDKNT